MLFRELPEGSIGISQPSHAWLSGQIIRAWGNSQFGAVSPYEDVCLSAEQHDMGWLVWERMPTWNPDTTRPHSFRELPVRAHTAIWSMGVSMARSLGRYPALLVSLHGTGLYANFDTASAGGDDADLVREFLIEQRNIQQRLIASLRAAGRHGEVAGDAVIERNRGLVRAADRMSIAICSGLRDVAIRSDQPFDAIVRDVPTGAGSTDLVLSAVNGDLTTISVTPWPFNASVVTVHCEGILLPPVPFGTEAIMRAELRHQDSVVLSSELRPG
jgi:hypothetical protein